ncbi:hypothetical protein GY45DRAFT_124069 [Cubamyces sp. BRFM 1775]|nr:hypothetical protein GY45DRAFT_124069 [Cubamyces sp. BRFM 1775]
MCVAYSVKEGKEAASRTVAADAAHARLLHPRIAGTLPPQDRPPLTASQCLRCPQTSAGAKARPPGEACARRCAGGAFVIPNAISITALIMDGLRAFASGHTTPEAHESGMRDSCTTPVLQCRCLVRVRVRVRPTGNGRSHACHRTLISQPQRPSERRSSSSHCALPARRRIRHRGRPLCVRFITDAACTWPSWPGKSCRWSLGHTI